MLSKTFRIEKKFEAGKINPPNLFLMWEYQTLKLGTDTK